MVRLENRKDAKNAKVAREEIEKVASEIVDAAITVHRALRRLGVLCAFAVFTPFGEGRRG